MYYRFGITQDDMKFIYESAKDRMDIHPEHAEKCKKRIQLQRVFTSEKDALKFALKKMKQGDLGPSYQIWAAIEKDADIYRIQNFWIVTDNNRVKMAAEYIGMALIYSAIELRSIIIDNINIEDVVA